MNIPTITRAKLRFRLVSAALGIAVGATSVAMASGPIGVSFNSGSSETLVAGDQAGAPGYQQTHWNNAGVGSANGTGLAVLDGTGSTTGVSVSWSSANTWNNGASTATADGKLMRGYLDSTGNANDNSSPYQFAANANRPEAYAEGLSAWMTSQGAVAYDVVVYFDGDATSGRMGEYWLQQSAGKGATGLPNALGADLTTHVFATDTANFTGTYTQVPMTSLSTKTATAGNFIVFSGLSSDNFILRTEEQNFRALINGFQIVPRSTLAAPTILFPPMSQVKYAGGKATFNVSGNGTTPHYQWVKVGSGNVPNATNAWFTLTNLTIAGDAGDYYVVVSNGAGAATSDPVTLTVLDLPVANSFAATALADNPISYWRLNEGGGPVFDYVGVYNGVAGSGVYPGDYALNYDTGFLGFEPANTEYYVNMFNNASDGSGAVLIPRNTRESTNRLTLVAWVYPGVQAPAWAGILMTRDGNETGLNYTENKDELGYMWNGRWAFRSGLIVPENQWSMIAMVVEPTKVTLYVGNQANGVTSSVDPQANSAISWGGDLWMGMDPNYGANRLFSGAMDEVAVFDSSLSQLQILNLYAAGIAGGNLPPVIGQQPVSKQVYAGSTVQLSVGAAGAGGLTYQWQKDLANVVNGARISGSQSNTLTISNVTAGDVGSYSVIVHNPAGSVTAGPANLSVLNPTGKAYEAAIIASNPKAYWRFSETTGTNAYDNIGQFTALYDASSVLGNSGPMLSDFPGFESVNTALQTSSNAPNSYVKVPPLNLNSSTVTMAGWFYPQGVQTNTTGLIYSRDAGTVSGLCYFGTQLGFNWANEPTDWHWASGLEIPSEKWVFMALVVETNQASVYLGTNGVLQRSIKTGINPVQGFAGITCIGTDTYNNSRTFNGLIDEVTIYDRSLSSDEIAGLFSKATGAGVAPAITMLTATNRSGWPGFNVTFGTSALGNGPLSYQWYKGTTAVVDGGNVAGAKTPSLTVSSATQANTGDYHLVVTGSAGQTTSVICSIRVDAVPADPYDSAMFAAHPVNFWRLNETSGTVAYDSVGGQHATYGSAVQLGVSGQITGATAAGFKRQTDQSWITVPALNLNTNAVTLLAWVRPNGQPDNWAGIFISTGSRAGLSFRDNANEIGFMWNNNFFWDKVTGVTAPAGTWSLVTLSVAPNSCIASVINSSGTQSYTLNEPMNAEAFSGESAIGHDPSNGADRVFDGSINQVAIFNRTLSSGDLQQFYVAGTTEQLPPITLEIQKNGANVQLLWSRGNLYQADQVNGTWTAVEGAVAPYTVSPTVTNKFYRVISNN